METRNLTDKIEYSDRLNKSEKRSRDIERARMYIEVVAGAKAMREEQDNGGK